MKLTFIKNSLDREIRMIFEDSKKTLNLNGKDGYIGLAPIPFNSQ